MPLPVAIPHFVLARPEDDVVFALVVLDHEGRRCWVVLAGPDDGAVLLDDEGPGLGDGVACVRRSVSWGKRNLGG